MTMSNTITSNATTETERQEISALEAVIATVESHQESEDFDDYLALFHPDLLWVTGFGTVITSRDEFEAFSRKELPGWNRAMKDNTVTYKVEHVTFIRPDVAAVALRQQVVGPDGQPAVGHEEGRPTYLMAKDASGAWRIVFAQNTHVVENWRPEESQEA